MTQWVPRHPLELNHSARSDQVVGAPRRRGLVRCAQPARDAIDPMQTVAAQGASGLAAIAVEVRQRLERVPWRGVGRLAWRRRELAERLANERLNVGRDSSFLTLRLAEDERSLEGVARLTAPRACVHVGLHARALLGTDRVLQVTREDRDDLGAPSSGRLLPGLKEGGESLADHHACSVQPTLHGVDAQPQDLGRPRLPSGPSTSRRTSTSRYVGSRASMAASRACAISRPAGRLVWRRRSGLESRARLVGVERHELLGRADAPAALLEAEATSDDEKPRRDRRGAAELAKAAGRREQRLLRRRPSRPPGRGTS